jgi:hypothetical protein
VAVVVLAWGVSVEPVSSQDPLVNRFDPEVIAADPGETLIFTFVGPLEQTVIEDPAGTFLFVTEQFSTQPCGVDLTDPNSTTLLPCLLPPFVVPGDTSPQREFPELQGIATRTRLSVTPEEGSGGSGCISRVAGTDPQSDPNNLVFNDLACAPCSTGEALVEVCQACVVCDSTEASAPLDLPEEPTEVPFFEVEVVYDGGGPVVLTRESTFTHGLAIGTLTFVDPPGDFPFSALAALLADVDGPILADANDPNSDLTNVDVGETARITPSGGIDTDGDGILDCPAGGGAAGHLPECDNCTFVRNADQLDTDQNGLGDVCQCGDVTGDGVTNVTDALAIARGEVLSNDPNFGKCDVNGDGSCNVTDALAIARGEVSSAPGSQLCPDYGAP